MSCFHNPGEENKYLTHCRISDYALEGNRSSSNVEKISQIRANVNGISTGFTDLDDTLSGLHPAELILVAARPAMGKTAFALSIAENVAFKSGLPLAFFSLDLSSRLLVRRLLAMKTKDDTQNIRNSAFTDTDRKCLIESDGVITFSKMIIDDTPGITITDLFSRCQKYKLDYGIQLVIIDYMQLITGSCKSRTISRQQEKFEISCALRQMARELNVPVIVLSQLSRAADLRQNSRPILSDLCKYDDVIVQDADTVMFIYRDDYYHEDSDEKGIAEINIAKHRSGSTGTVDLMWLRLYNGVN